MNTFPTDLKVENKEAFQDIRYNNTLCYMRKNIYEHILSHLEDDYWDFGAFVTLYNIESHNSKKMIDTIIEELMLLGWNCKLCYGDTGLFIYSTEDLPHNCWDNGW